MTKLQIIAATAFIVFVLVFVIYHFVFSIYEVTYKISSSRIYADNESTVEISAVPVNSFGARAPFRKAYADFTIKEGAALVEVIEKDNDSGKIILKSKAKTGIVIIHINSKYAILPTEIQINIIPNQA
jgi:hypothetical protein